MENPDNWDSGKVGEWLAENGFGSYVELLCNQHRVDGKVLLTLTEDDLRQPPLQVQVLGDIKRLMIHIRQLQMKNQHVVKELGVELPAQNGDISHNTATESHVAYKRGISGYSDYDDGGTGESSPAIHKQYSKKLNPEYKKLLLSYVYMFTVFLCTSFTMVVVNDQVPDMDKYPPLPDIFLDNMPLVPWAFDMCELTALALSLILTITLLFHKHRFIILRRLFALTGTVFLLRCFTMWITSLSVPGRHLQCQPKVHDSLWSKLERAFVIWRGCGMSLQGVRTCGDYMFSGHTVMVTMLNFFITEYTPRWMNLLHTASWVMNIFGVFFILAAHEHYSIDVFVAFYITSRLFLYYHSLANNRALKQPDHRRTRIWFPMFSYFESSIDGIVPNEYESPVTWILRQKQKWLTRKQS